jgi:hypothetical protein
MTGQLVVDMAPPVANPRRCHIPITLTARRRSICVYSVSRTFRYDD